MHHVIDACRAEKGRDRRLVRFRNRCGGAEVDCGCDRSLAVDYRVFAEEIYFSGCRAGCGHVIVCLLFSVRGY